MQVNHMQVTHMQVTPLTPQFGAAITGVQLGNLDDAQFAAIKQAWHQHRGLLAFPQQHVSDDGLLVFSRRLGQLDSPPNQENGRQSPAGYPDIYVVSNVKDDVGRPIGALGDGEAVWHTDMSYETSPPHAGWVGCAGSGFWPAAAHRFDTLVQCRENPRSRKGARL